MQQRHAASASRNHISHILTREAQRTNRQSTKSHTTDSNKWDKPNPHCTTCSSTTACSSILKRLRCRRNCWWGSWQHSRRKKVWQSTQRPIPDKHLRKRLIIQHCENRRQETHDGRSHRRTLRQRSLGRRKTKQLLVRTGKSQCNRLSSTLSDEIKQRKSRHQSLETH